MAIKSRMTLGGILLVEVDTNPIVIGADAPIGSMALLVDSVNSRQFTKVGSNSIDWIQSTVSGAQVRNSIQTLDAVSSQLLSIPVSLNTLSKFTIDVVGVTEDGVTGAVYIVDVTAKNSYGVTEIVDILNRFTSSQDANLSLDFDVSAANLIATVKGLGGVTLNWNGVSQQSDSLSLAFTPIQGLIFWQSLISQTQKQSYITGGGGSTLTSYRPIDIEKYSGDLSFSSNRILQSFSVTAGQYRLVGKIGVMVQADSVDQAFQLFALDIRNNDAASPWVTPSQSNSLGNINIAYNAAKNPDNLLDYDYINVDLTFTNSSLYHHLVLRAPSASVAGAKVWMVLGDNFRMEKIS